MTVAARMRTTTSSNLMISTPITVSKENQCPVQQHNYCKTDRMRSKYQQQPVSIRVLGLIIVCAVLLRFDNELLTACLVESKKSATDSSLRFTSNDKQLRSSQSVRELHNVKLFTTRGRYQLIETVPHDNTAYTQGLVVVTGADGKSYFLEGTGLYGQSDLRYVDIPTGNVLGTYDLSSQYFGEGITNYNYYPNGFKRNGTNPLRPKQRLIQITWKEKTAFLYDDILKTDSNNKTIVNIQPPFTTMTYSTSNTEGWGVTYRPDRHIFYVTDGSSNIHVWDADTFQQISIQPVFSHRFGLSPNGPIHIPYGRLNELEWDPVSKTILANVYLTNSIVRIDPETGMVVTIYDLKGLYTNRDPSADVLNGIALTADFMTSGEIWVTGKLWPKAYRIKLIS